MTAFPLLSDERIDAIANQMPNGIDGFLKNWGWRQFAEAIESESRAPLLAEIERLTEQVGRLKAENHNLNWALGSDGYDQMATPEEQAEADAHHARVIENIERMKARAERHRRLVPEGEDALDVVERLKADAERYQWLKNRTPLMDGGFSCSAGIEVTEWGTDGCGVEVSGDALDVAIDAARAQGGEL